MRHAGAVTLKLLCACLLAAASQTFSARAQAPDCVKWGEAVDGIELSVSKADLTVAEEGQSKYPNLRVAFRNSGEKDVNLYLGFKGGAPHPFQFNFKLHVTDARGRTRVYEYKGPMYVAGRLDPIIVHLRAGAVYTLDVRMAQFWSPDTREYELDLDPGPYEVFLEFEGRAAGVINLDQPHVKRMTFWKGALRSNTFEVMR